MTALSAAIAALHAEGRPRVWSLVVTLFGDAAVPRGGRMATQRLQALLGQLQIEPGALRTALSRLAADGWLDRDRDGRATIYRLSPARLAETRAAGRRIYAAPAPAPSAWTLGLGPAPEGALALGADGWIAPGSLPEGGLAVTGPIAALGPAGFDRICPEPGRSDLAHLRAEALALAAAAPDLTPVQAMAARTLLIHRWRRIVLRGQDRPNALLPPDLADPSPRAAVASAYVALLPAAESWLSSDEGGLQPMPPADGSLAARFASDFREQD